MGDPSTTKGQPFHVGSSVGKGVSPDEHVGYTQQLSPLIRYFPVRSLKVVSVFQKKQSRSATPVILSAKLGAMT